MNKQLNLFEQIGCEYFRTGADKLLNALNLGLKAKDFTEYSITTNKKNYSL